MQIINNDDILMHYGITEDTLMNYYGLSKPEYDAYIAHYGIKGMLWGFANGVRQAGKRIAEGISQLDYEKTMGKHNANVGEYASQQRTLNSQLASQKQVLNSLNRANSLNDHRVPNKEVNSAISKWQNKITGTQGQLNAANYNSQLAQNRRSAYQNSTIGKIAKGIYTTKNAAASKIRAVSAMTKSTASKAATKGRAVGSKLLSKVSSLSGKASRALSARGANVISKALTNLSIASSRASTKLNDRIKNNKPTASTATWTHSTATPSNTTRATSSNATYNKNEAYKRRKTNKATSSNATKSKNPLVYL